MRILPIFYIQWCCISIKANYEITIGILANAIKRIVPLQTIATSRNYAFDVFIDVNYCFTVVLFCLKSISRIKILVPLFLLIIAFKLQGIISVSELYFIANISIHISCIDRNIQPEYVSIIIGYIENNKG